MAPFSRRVGKLAAAIAAAVLLTQVAADREADACGGFGRLGSTSVPSVAVERVLLVHDEAKGVEHFVREVAFSSAKETFGFVVPTPSKPTVAKVDDVDWGRLNREHPFSIDKRTGGVGYGRGSGRLGGSGGVKVLEHKRVGSFASYVLDASSGEAMKKWLSDNRFQTTAASQTWLDHYVRLGFYFVALRFEPQLAKETRTKNGDFDFARGGAETVRISFETPVPYYPYREPDAGDVGVDRILSLWLLTSSPKVPVALRKEVPNGETVSYVRPWREGIRSSLAPDAPALVGPKTWKATVPAGPLVLQTFEDQKRSRRGFGDVLLVPEKPTPADAEARAKWKRLFGLLDAAADR